MPYSLLVPSKKNARHLSQMIADYLKFLDLKFYNCQTTNKKARPEDKSCFRSGKRSVICKTEILESDL